MAVRRLYEPLCIAFGTTVSSPTVPTYQLYDLPHKFTPRLYMESEDPNLVLREIGVSMAWQMRSPAVLYDNRVNKHLKRQSRRSHRKRASAMRLRLHVTSRS